MYDYSEFKKHKAYKYMQDCVNDKLIVIKKDGEIINIENEKINLLYGASILHLSSKCYDLSCEV